MNQFITCFDIETTGLNPKTDFIIQLAILKFDKKTKSVIKSKTWYVKPAHAYNISPQAEAVHGLSKEFIEKNGVYFKDIIDEVNECIIDSDYLTYNGNNFDVKFMYEEYKRWGKEFPIDGKQFYDSFAMECRFNPRDLSSVYKKYTGKDMQDAHDALADVKATMEVFLHQMKSKELTFEDLNSFTENTLLTPDGSIRNTAAAGEPMRIVFAVGKYKDSEFMEITEKDPSYIKWYMENVASNYTKKILSQYYANNRKKV